MGNVWFEEVDAWRGRRVEIADSRGSEEAEQERTENWHKNVEKHVKFITRFSREVSDRNDDPTVEFPLAEQFRLKRLPEEIDDKVDEARG